MKKEAHGTLVEHFVHNFLVELRAERTSSQSLCFTACEYCRSVGCGQRVGFAPDGTYVGIAAAVETALLVEHATAHGVALHIVVVAVDKRILLFEFVFGKSAVCGSICFLEILAYLREGIFACMLVAVAFERNLICLVVAFLAHLLAKFFIVGFVAVLALHVGSELLRELHLHAAHGLDCLVCGLECTNKVLLRNFIHFAFHHHDVVFGGSNHKVDVGVFHLLVCGVDNIFSVNAGNANFRDGSLERDVGTCQSCRCGKTCKSVGHVNSIG